MTVVLSLIDPYSFLIGLFAGGLSAAVALLAIDLTGAGQKRKDSSHDAAQ